MASLSTLTTAFLKTSQESTFTLANLNFNFTLMKYDAPEEYRALGESLSSHRRKAAEDGAIHIAARKLTALFQSVIPPVPKLIHAYGLRVSEIAKLPTVNPKGTLKQGIFADHVGADGTSIWASATSGSEAVTMHLLACMLARIWKREEAIAIWTEFVQQRKLHLQSAITECDGPLKISDLAASHIELTRTELDEWDASARSWLQTADEGQRLRQTQLRLIIDNISLPVWTGGNVYSAILEAWTSALETMENLIKGAPHRISNGAILLALSAWHLYPDMFFAGTNQHIKQSDPLIGTGGLMTIGLTNKTEDDGRGVFWSLPLTQARYYGEPIIATRHAGVGESQVQFEDFILVVIGSVLLIRFGQRNCANSLASHKHYPAPAFGLTNFSFILKSLGTDTQTAISFLRSWAVRELEPRTAAVAVIRYRGSMWTKYHYTNIDIDPESVPPLKKQRVGNSLGMISSSSRGIRWSEDDDDQFLASDILNDAEEQIQELISIPPSLGAQPKPYFFICGDTETAIYLPSSQKPVKAVQNNCMDASQLHRCVKNGDLNETQVLKTFEELQTTMCCIAFFETGTIDLDLEELGDHSFAVCHANSIFVGSRLLSDPINEIPHYFIERIIGNVGKPGLTFLVTPPDPMVQDFDPSLWHLIAHEKFDGLAQDCFQGTSFHLPFTGYEHSLHVGQRSVRDVPARLLETAVSVYDKGKWIADLDILEASMHWMRVPKLSCPHLDGAENVFPRSDLVSVDSWLELLDPPQEGQDSVVRAHGNPIARIATAALATRKRPNVVILPNKVCWQCQSLQTIDNQLFWVSGIDARELQNEFDDLKSADPENLPLDKSENDDSEEVHTVPGSFLIY
ncbi:hypothetical protein GGI43DRAFT_425088 [Trichoderma evansii]